MRPSGRDRLRELRDRTAQQSRPGSRDFPASRSCVTQVHLACMESLDASQAPSANARTAIDHEAWRELPGRSYQRVTDTGRRLSARPRVQVEPDMQRLVQLVLHIADALHHNAQSAAPSQGSVGGAREDETNHATHPATARGGD